MKFLKKMLPLLFISSFFLSVQSYEASAMPTEDLKQDEEGQVGYSIQKMSRDNTEASYFDLYVKPKDKKTLKARIFNETDKEITVRMDIFTASTSSKVQVVYTQPSPKNDESMQYYLEDLVKIDAKNNEVKVPADDHVDVEANVSIPEEVSGVLLGSWYFEKKSEENKENKEGVSISNQYSYAMAIKLEASQISNPNLNLLKVEPGLDNYKRAIVATVQNDRPALMSGVAITTSVKEKEGKEVLYKSEAANLKIAPNTTFDYPTFVDGDLLKAGKYVFEMNVKTSDSKLSKVEWDLKKEFTITDKEVDELNKGAINEENSSSSIWLIVGIIALSVIVIALVVWMILRNRALKKRNQNKLK